MASTNGAHTVQGDLVRGVLAEVNTLTVDRLKRVLKAENLTVSGLKNELQIRLRARTSSNDSHFTTPTNQRLQTSTTASETTTRMA